MTKLAALLFIAAALVAAFLFYQRHKRGTPQAPRSVSVIDHAHLPNTSVRGAGKFVPYRPSSPRIDFDLRYPENWHVGEARGSAQDYDQVIVQGPRNADGSYNATAVFLAAPIQSRSPYQDLSTLKAATLRPYASGPKASLNAEDASALMAGQPAVALSGVFEVTVPVSASQGKKVLVSQSDLIAVRGSRLYRITFSCDASAKEEWKPVFDEMLRSFRFRD